MKVEMNRSHQFTSKLIRQNPKATKMQATYCTRPMALSWQEMYTMQMAA